MEWVVDIALFAAGYALCYFQPRLLVWWNSRGKAEVSAAVTDAEAKIMKQ